VIAQESINHGWSSIFLMMFFKTANLLGRYVFAKAGMTLLI
jgi:hypothetical protein